MVTPGSPSSPPLAGLLHDAGERPGLVNTTVRLGVQFSNSGQRFTAEFDSKGPNQCGSGRLSISTTKVVEVAPAMADHDDFPIVV